MAKDLVHTLFEGLSREQAELVAVEEAEMRVSYGELGREAEELSGLLRRLGVGAGEVVGMALPAGIRGVRSLVAIFRSGGVYLPVDRRQAEGRLRQMFDETHPRIVIAGSEDSEWVQEWLPARGMAAAYVVLLPQQGRSLVGELGLEAEGLIGWGSEGRQVLRWQSEGGYRIMEQGELGEVVEEGSEVEGAGSNYIFYTSGSTGGGKGIVGSHRSLGHYIGWHIREWAVGPGVRIAQVASLGFDASLKDIWVALCSGATLCIAPEESRQDMGRLAEWLREAGVTMLQTVPSLFRLLTRELQQQGAGLPALRYVLLSGERLYGRDVVRWEGVNGRGARLTNLYGLTETTILKSCYHIERWEWEPGEVIPVGRGISQSLLAVISQDHVCSVGELGEVYIKSPFMSKGYVRQELNAGMFVDNPLGGGDKVCRTGDLGRYREDGTIEIWGRRDEQVKVHGVRVELGEVRGALLGVEGVESVEVLVHEEQEGGQELLCYYTGRRREAEWLREAVGRQVSGALVPGYYVWLEAFPLNVNGKVDRKGLPRPAELERAESYEGPVGAVEEKLAGIWREVLRVDRIGRGDSILGLGGSSLKTIQFISRVYKELGVQLPVGEVFMHPTLAGQAELMRRLRGARYASIGKVTEELDYELSHAQKRLWLLEQRWLSQERAGLQTLHNVPLSFRLRGRLDRGALERSLLRVVERHESLRTVFVEVGGEPRQRVLKAGENGFGLQLEDLRERIEEVRAMAEEEARREVARPFDLERGPLLRARLLQVGEAEYYLLFTIHHLVADEWSMQVLAREVITLYNAAIQGGEDPLKPLPIQYKDYAAWQRGQLSGERLEELRRYWLRELDGDLPVLELAGDRPRPAVQTYNGDSYAMVFSAELSRGLEELGRGHEATLFMVLLAGLSALLYRYTGQEDLVIGTPVAGREHADLEEQIGYYLNTLALRSRPTGGQSFGELLEEVRRTALGAYAHQAYPFDWLVEELGAGRDTSRSPLFDVALLVQNIQLEGREQPGMAEMEVDLLGAELQTSKSDLRFQFALEGNQLRGSIEYNTDLYDRERVELISGDLERLLGAVVKEPGVALQDIGYRLPGEEKGRAERFVSSQEQQPELPLIHRVIGKWVLRQPERVAVDQEGEETSYRELNEAANRLAQVLVGLEVRREEPVVMLLPAGHRAVSGLLGCLKAGVVYVPLGLGRAVNRVRQAMAELGPRIVVGASEEAASVRELLERWGGSVRYMVLVPQARPEWLSGLEVQQGELIRFAQGLQVWEKEDDRWVERPWVVAEGEPEVEVEGAGNNYIFYTSGSTGRGKGVVGSHRSLSHYIHWQIQEWGIGPGMRISQLAPLSFDASLKDMLVALASGATLCVPRASTRENMERLGEWLRESEVTILQTVPSVLRILMGVVKAWGSVPALPGLRAVVLAGERLYGRDVVRWEEVNGRGARLSNLYGLTETTILKSCFHIERWEWEAGEVIPVGMGIGETSIAVIRGNRVCRTGEVGEVYIRSPFVSKGYWEPGLNAGVFVQNPLVKDREDRVCRTGDLGRYREDGNLEVLGRRDEQVKVHGARVELEEVRRAVLELEGIDQVEVVVHQEGEEEQELICYYSGEGRWKEDELREALRRQLEGYLVPAYVERVERFPLNVNGKVDRQALPRPKGLGLRAGSEEGPREGIEKKLAEIWKEVLRVDRIGREESILSLGGSSLKTIQFISRVYKELGVQLPVGDVFTHPTLARQAELVGGLQREQYYRIGKTAEGPDYGLSHAQKRTWIFEQLHQGTRVYNIPLAYRLVGQLNRGALERSLLRVVERHESLRTVFVEVGGEPRQRVLGAGESGFDLQVEDLRERQARMAQVEEVRAMAEEEVQREAARPFDLERGPLLRARLLQVGKAEYYLLFTIHHIVADEWSMKVLTREVIMLYNADMKGGEAPLETLPIQYKDYAAWQQEQLLGARLEELRGYWLREMDGALPVLELMADRPRPAVQTYRGDRVTWQLEPELSNRLEELGRGHEATLFMVLLAGLSALLYRYTGQEDLVIGTPVAGRDHADLEEQIGFFVNTLALRSRPKGGLSFGELLEEVRRTALGAYAHQGYPFDLLVEELKPPRESSRPPLFNIMLIVFGEKLNETLPDMRAIQVMPATGDSYASLFDITIRVMEHSDLGHHISIEYNTDMFDRERIERMRDHFEGLLRAVTNDPGQAIGQLQYISAEERRRLVETFNDTGAGGIGDRTIVELFEEQVEQMPEAVAVICGERRLSYRELNEKANRLGAYLRDQYQIVADDLVAIKTIRSEWMLISLLGVLKAGAGYVPVDGIYPPDRVAYMLADSRSKVLIDERELNKFRELQETYDGGNPDKRSGPGNLAYVIYTSGTTGRPKGVMIEHGSLANYLRWANRYYFQDGQGHPFGMFTSLAFDLSVTGIFSGLLRGDYVYLSQEGQMPEALKEVFTVAGVRTIKLTPSHISLLPELEGLQATEVDTVIAGGEAFLPVHYSILKGLNPGMRIFNEYGPTEATVGCMISAVSGEAEVTIGRPIWNTRIYIVDEAMNLQPMGIPGEICIGGAGVSRGYAGKEELTKKSFVRGLFGERALYRTGDIGMWKADGCVLYRGRKDDQVKVNGLRVELEEIVQTLMTYPDINQAAATLICENDKPFLAAFYSGQIHAPNSLREHLRRSLPEYMIPAYFSYIEKMPLTANGKVDKAALSLPGGLTRHEYVSPKGEIERKLARIWSEILSVEKVGILDNFIEIGGNSLTTIRAIVRIQRELAVKLELKEIFAHPVLKDQAELIRQSKRNNYTPLIRLGTQADYPASFGQKRLWVLNQMEEYSPAYNILMSYRVKGGLSPELLERSFSALIERHEILRTTFHFSEDGVRQRILPVGDMETVFSTVDLCGLSDQDALLQEIAEQESCRKFDLKEGPLLRVVLIRLSEQEHGFIMAMHHIISDEWSIGVMFRDLMVLYKAYREGKVNPLGSLEIQYKDYAVWQQGELSGERLERHRGYWLEQLSGELPVLELPADRVRPAVMSFRGGRVQGMLSREWRRWREMAGGGYSASSFMVATALVKLLLYRYTGQGDVIIGCPIAGREHPDLEEQIGFYINTLVLRTRLEGGMDFRGVLEGVKKTVLDAYEHQLYPFDLLVTELGKSGDMSRSPLFDVMVVMEQDGGGGVWRQEEGWEGLRIEEIGVEIGVSKFDMTFHFREQGDELTVSIEYNTDIYDRDRMERMVGHLKELLLAVVKTPERPIGKLEYVGAEERGRVLQEFNDRGMECPEGKTVLDLFGQRAMEEAEVVAVRYEGKQKTYGQLKDESDRVAGYLIRSGVEKGQVVALCMERSIEMIIGLLGILKAGAAYMPIDLSYPLERIGYMLLEADGCLTDGRGHELLGELRGVELMDIAEAMAVNGSRPEVLSGRLPGPEDLCYVIYTSGSTGQPKGVELHHGALFNLTIWHQQQRKKKTGCRVLQFASINFDASFQEIFSSLCFGGELQLINEEERRDMSALLSVVIKEKVQQLFIPYVVLKGLSEAARVEERYPAELEEVFTAGEQLKLTADIEELMGRTGAELWNYYGPSETHVVTAYKVEEGDFRGRGLPPIGKPIGNCRIYILDEWGQACAVGIWGEIWIGGAGVGRGYINRPELTAERFVRDPFGGEGDHRMYRSGDTGRWLSDGNIEFGGRRDEQVKVRGYRVELGEIEQSLLRVPGVSAAVVVAREAEDGQKYLAGYVVKGEETADCRQALGRMLPEYMVPAYIVELESIPMTANGKVDKRRLPSPQGISRKGQYRSPVSTAGWRLAAIWEEVLGVSQVGLDDNFFEIGGHSLKAIKVIHRIRRELEVKLGLKELFRHPVLAGQVKLIEQSRREEYRPIEVLGKQERYVLSHGQRRLWMLNEVKGLSRAYELELRYRLQGHVDVEAMQEAFRLLIGRHEILRTVIRVEQGEPYQYILPHDTFPFAVDYQDLRHSAATNSKPLTDISSGKKKNGSSPDRRRASHAQWSIASEVISPWIIPALSSGTSSGDPFDLENGPLLRVKLLQSSEADWLFSVCLHHIISDEWSMKVMFGELILLYNTCKEGGTNPLPAPPIQYKDYAAWQQQELSGSNGEEHRRYWLQKLSGELPLLDLMTDRPRPKKKRFRGAYLAIDMDASSLMQLKDLCRINHASLFMGLVAIVKLLLYRYTGQRDLILGCPVSGREHPDLEDQLGFYVNTVALRTVLDGDRGFDALLGQVKGTILEAMEHYLYPFDLLVDDLKIPRNTSRSPLFDVMVVMQHQTQIREAVQRNPDGLVFANLPDDSTCSKFDLTFYFKESSQGITVGLNYNSDIYDPERMTALMGRFQGTVSEVVQNPDDPLTKMASPPKKDQLEYTL